MADEKSKKISDVQCGEKGKLNRKPKQMSMEESLFKARVLAKIFLKDSTKKDVELELRKMLHSMTRGLTAALSRREMDQWRKAYILSAIARKNYIEYELVPPEQQKKCFDNVLSSALMGAEACSERCEKGGHAQHEASCLQIAADLLVSVDRPKEAMALSRRLLESRCENKKVGKDLKYHMAVMELVLLGGDAPDEIEPGFVSKFSFADFDEKKEKLLKEYPELFLRLDNMTGVDLNPNAPFDDWPKQLAHKKKRRAAVLGLYLRYFLEEGRKKEDTKRAVAMATPVFDRLKATSLYKDLCALCPLYAKAILRVVDANAIKARKELVALSKSLGSLQGEDNLVDQAAKMLETKAGEAEPQTKAGEAEPKAGGGEANPVVE